MATAELNQDLAVLGQIGCLKCAEVRVHQLFLRLTEPRSTLLDVSDPAPDTFLLIVDGRVALSGDWKRRDGLHNAPGRSYARQRVSGQVVVD